MNVYTVGLLVCLLLLGCTAQKETAVAATPTNNENDAPPPMPQESTDKEEPRILPKDSTEETISANTTEEEKVVITDPLPIMPAPKNKTDEPNRTLAPSIKPQAKIINGKTLHERLQEASDRLHTQGSGERARNDFPDFELVYTDTAKDTGFPDQILPFKYYYSKEADKTFNICNIDFTVFICNGKLERVITKEDIDNKRCEVTPVYTGDPRIGGSGAFNYGYN